MYYVGEFGRVEIAQIALKLFKTSNTKTTPLFVYCEVRDL